MGVTGGSVKKHAILCGISLDNRKGYWTKSKPMPPKGLLSRNIRDAPLYKVAKIYKVGEELIKKWARIYNIYIPNNRDRTIQQWKRQKRINNSN